MAHRRVAGCFGWVGAVSPRRRVYWCVFTVETRSGGSWCSTVAVVSHEGDDTGGRSGHLEEGVLEEVLGSGSLGGFPHQHPVQEGPQDRGHLRSLTRVQSQARTSLPVGGTLHTEWLHVCSTMRERKRPQLELIRNFFAFKNQRIS